MEPLLISCNHFMVPFGSQFSSAQVLQVGDRVTVGQTEVGKVKWPMGNGG